MAYIKGYSGAVTQVKIPTMTQAVRPGALALAVTPAIVNNMFSLATIAAGATVSADLYRINRRYTLLTSITTNELHGGVNTLTAVAVVMKPDNRNQFVGTFSYADFAAATVVGSLTGHINYDTSVFTFNVTYAGGTAGSVYTATAGVLSMRFMPTNTMNGRIKVSLN